MPSNDGSGAGPKGLQSNGVFVVTTEQLLSQLTLGAQVQGEHWIWPDSHLRIITSDGPRTAVQVAWYLKTSRWVDELFTTCNEPSCVAMDHLTDDQAQAQQARDEADLALVQRSSVSLADLYRKGKARGLLTSRTQYH